MRRILASVGVLLLGLAAAGSARADHPYSSHGAQPCQDECKPKHGLHKLWPFGSRQDECQPKHSQHKLWPFSGHKLSGHHGGGNQPWFNTYKPCPGPESAFPVHPFVRSPRDFFMYEW